MKCTKLSGIEDMHKLETNTFFLVDVSKYMFLNLQHEWVFIATKGMVWTT
jgi:hypothetical protein